MKAIQFFSSTSENLPQSSRTAATGEPNPVAVATTCAAGCVRNICCTPYSFWEQFGPADASSGGGSCHRPWSGRVSEGAGMKGEIAKRTHGLVRENSPN